MHKQLILGALSSAKAQLLNTFNAVPDDTLGWKPLDKGRTALDAFSDAAQTAGMTAQLVASRGEMKIDREVFMQLAQQRAAWTKQTALDELETGHAALLKAVEEASDEDLAKPVTLGVGGGMTMPLGAWAMMAQRSYVSRFAQINYIQTLYGDTESH